MQAERQDNLLYRAVSAIDASLLSGLHEASFPHPWTEKAFLDLLVLPTVSGGVAYIDEEPCGFYLCQQALEEAEVLTVCVVPSMRRRRIGVSLMAHMQAFLKERGSEKLFLEVAADNVSAISLYEKTGFKKTGCRKNYYKTDNGSKDALLFVCNL